MRLATVQVTKYRSIEQTPKLAVSPGMTVLLGPNNEGKSNLLGGIALGLATLQQLGQRRPRSVPMVAVDGKMNFRLMRNPRGPSYDWETDYPARLRETEPEGKTKIFLEFTLDGTEEIRQFKNEVGSTLNGTLPIELSFGSDGEGSIRVKKPGRGAHALAKKADRVSRFVSRRLDFEYVPAVRTAQSAHAVIESMVEAELYRLEEDSRYKEALKRLRALEAPVLRRVSRNITRTLQDFLPDVQSVSLKLERSHRGLGRQPCEIIVDDGASTRLESKGDGVVSLAAIGLVRHVASRSLSRKSLILAVEEPESHLHPRSIRELLAVLEDVADEHQVIITTHNPVLVERNEIGANILVERQQAKCARSIAEIRESLGVSVGDNLVNSEVVLVVEGESDRTVARALLCDASSSLGNALRDGRLGIQTLAGGSNLSYQVEALDTSIIRVHCLLDDDSDGRNAFTRACDLGLLLTKQATFVRAPHRSESELEDWFEPSVYSDILLRDFGPVLSSSVYRQHTGKWSDRVRDTVLNDFGGYWSDGVEAKLKAEVASAAAAEGLTALRRFARRPFSNLAATLEQMLRD